MIAAGVSARPAGGSRHVRPLQVSSLIMNNIRTKSFPAIIYIAIIMAGLAPAAAAAASFSQWVADFRQTARQNGISDPVFNRAFKGVDAPDPQVLEKAAYQPEFVDPAWNYFDNRINAAIIALGRKNAAKWAGWLAKIEKRFGVDRNILLAIWSMETGYGEIMKRDDVMRDAFRSLATLAYADPKRARYARAQLLAALKILQNGDIDRAHLRGSWAGALGHTQFIPSSYLAYAVDIDGDGKRDIWNSVPDALASAANLLAKNGWKPRLHWGYEVILPRGEHSFPADRRSFRQWRHRGFDFVKGQRWPLDTEAELKLPDGSTGPAFLVTRNFFVLKRYNNSDRYALAVGLLADAIGGHPPLKQDWQRPFAPTSSAEKAEIQQRLKNLGLYDGNIDGKIGSGTRNAIAAFQRQNAVEPTGYPSMEVLQLLRRKP